MSTMPDTSPIPALDSDQIARANDTEKTPVVFIHGLWLLPSSWDRWATVFEEAGYVGLTPSWPDDPATVGEANAHPEVFAGKSVGQVADHYDQVISQLDRKPAVIGHPSEGCSPRSSPGGASRRRRSRSTRRPSGASSRCPCRR